jgi:hypothetical protein
MLNHRFGLLLCVRLDWLSSAIRAPSLHAVGNAVTRVLDFGATFRSSDMTLRPRNRMTAWLGLIAMWLIVFAPVVSQVLAASHAHEPVAALCSALQPQDQGHASQSAVHLSHDDAFGACGYCHLLKHHVAIPFVPPAAPVTALAVASVAPSALSTRFTPLGAFPSGRPRDPPAVS